MEKIKSIYLLKNAFIKNKHNDRVFDKQQILVVEYDNNERNYIDMITQQDITNIDYYDIIIEQGKTKTKKIFLETNHFI